MVSRVGRNRRVVCNEAVRHPYASSLPILSYHSIHLQQPAGLLRASPSLPTTCYLTKCSFLDGALRSPHRTTVGSMTSRFQKRVAIKGPTLHPTLNEHCPLDLDAGAWRHMELLRAENHPSAAPNCPSPLCLGRGRIVEGILLHLAFAPLALT